MLPPPPDQHRRGDPAEPGRPGPGRPAPRQGSRRRWERRGVRRAGRTKEQVNQLRTEVGRKGGRLAEAVDGDADYRSRQTNGAREEAPHRSPRPPRCWLNSPPDAAEAVCCRDPADSPTFRPACASEIGLSPLGLVRPAEYCWSCRPIRGGGPRQVADLRGRSPIRRDSDRGRIRWH